MKWIFFVLAFLRLGLLKEYLSLISTGQVTTFFVFLFFLLPLLQSWGSRKREKKKKTSQKKKREFGSSSFLTNLPPLSHARLLLL